MAEGHKEILQKYRPVSSEREIRKLYVNLHRVFLLFFQNYFLHRMRSRHR